MRKLLLLLTSLAVGLAASGSPAAAAKARPPAGYAEEIRPLLQAPSHAHLRWTETSDLREELERLYEPSAWQPQWLAGGRPTEAAKRLVDRLAAAGTVGLDPADYDVPWLVAASAELVKSGAKAPFGRAAAFDVTLSIAALRFVTVLACGRVDPVALGGVARRADDACLLGEESVARLRDPRAQDAVLARLDPTFPAYARLKQGLARYLEVARDSTLVPLPAIPADLRPDMPLAAAPALRRLLQATGDWTGTTAPKATKDVLYTPDLVLAVKRFQRRHGLLPDGILWSQTIEQLNRPPSDRVRQIALTLERWRSLRPSFETPPIIVNIPAFRLEAYRALPDRATDPLAMDVLVGAAAKNETPTFSAPMTHVIFRPYWEVPADIAKYELGPRALLERENMERLGYVLVRGGTEVPLTPENIRRLGQGVRMRQRPGESNALGLIKFMLPNGHDIYLHDTSAQGLFILPRRDFSHGCVRVDNPVALAAQVLEGVPGWTPEKVKAAMMSGEDNVRVNLAKPVPVHLVYATAVASENGHVSFHSDVYGEDAKLEAMIEKAGARARRDAQGRISTGVPTGTTR